MSDTAIASIGTAVPKYQHHQTDVAQFMKNALSADVALGRRIDYLYHRSQIRTRYSCIPDYSCVYPRHFEFYPQNWRLAPSPTTGQRMAKYQAESLQLCIAAVADALSQPNASNLSEVTHLIVVSCTGFYAPGLDIHLVKALGLSPDVERTLIGFMGCYAAFNGIRVADAICRSDTDATVLLICVELCTLHFQQSPVPHHLIANGIFADGAAAVFFSRRTCFSTCGQSSVGTLSHRRHALLIKNSSSWIDDDSLNEMTWTIGDTGFEMQISPAIPKILAVNLPVFIQRLLKPYNLDKTEIDFWAVHPGGRAILDTVQQRLDLSVLQIEDSRAVLRDYGNMSSPSVLFVLKRMLQRLQNGEALQHCVAMAFGPGLTLEGCLLEIAR